MKNCIDNETDERRIMTVMDLDADGSHPFLQGRLVAGWGYDDHNTTDNADTV